MTCITTVMSSLTDSGSHVRRQVRWNCWAPAPQSDWQPAAAARSCWTWDPACRTPAPCAQLGHSTVPSSAMACHTVSHMLHAFLSHCPQREQHAWSSGTGGLADAEQLRNTLLRRAPGPWQPHRRPQRLTQARAPGHACARWWARRRRPGAVSAPGRCAAPAARPARGRAWSARRQSWAARPARLPGANHALAPTIHALYT